MNPPKIIAGLTGPAASFFLGSNLFLDSLPRPLLLITPTEKEAEARVEELRLFLPSHFTIINFPSWETKPFDLLTPSRFSIAERLGMLWKLHNTPLIIVAPVEALMQKVTPKKDFLHYSITLEFAQTLDLGNFKKQLSVLGYQFQEQVTDIGDVAIRGNIIDIFSPAHKDPLRLELFGDEIESIRSFDPDTQLSGVSLDRMVIIPSREVLWSTEHISLGKKRIKELSDTQGIPKATRDQWLDQLHEGFFFREIENWVPLFYASLSTIFDYFPSQTFVLYDSQRIHELANTFEEEYRQNWDLATKELRLVPHYKELFLSSEELFQIIDPKTVLKIEPLIRTDLPEGEKIHVELITGITPASHALSVDPLKPLISHFQQWRKEGDHIVVATHTLEQAIRLRELLGSHDFETRRIETSLLEAIPHLTGKERVVHTILGSVENGFRYFPEHLTLISEEEIFGIRRRRRPRPSKESPAAAFFASLAELQPGDYVVHVEHGIGQYEGLKQLFREGGQKDYLLLRYKGKDRLYLPVHRVNLLQKYIGPEQGRIQLDQLGGQSWERRKRRVNEAVEELAGELLKLYAAREIVKGYKFSPPDPFFHEFEGTFEFEETEDQQRAIDEVLEDMCKQKPMDRLVCGDVGYGKTEVALRAAFKSVLDHKQVAVLCPTTLLAAQHERTFKERFKDFPVTIELLSRFRTTREQKEVIKKIERGEIDILIGTHLLLSKRVQFRDLGLVVIDEEQRFGVKQKERLKSLRTEVDILTLTATPIPRTLSLSLSGLRDLSIINTPPADRHAIKTFVTPFHEEVIRDAILNELQRGGQIFFVHNRVQTIASITRTLQQILPEARFGIAHGQLPERALEKVMSRFLNREIDVLVCSAIIESGLDIPSANTLVVNRADTFGLAQLYQLRGRVGRSKEQAYAYLLIPSDQTITIEAQQRLEVLQRYTEFGSGFRIASHDLELRGGGDILGGEQSGHIAAVGFELYTRLLDEAIRTLRGEKVEPQIEPEIKLQVPAFIPQEYIADTKQRLALYKRLATASSDEELGILRQEMRDRFGPVPNPTENLFQVMCVKHRLQRLRARTLTATADQITLEFDPSTPLKTEQVLLLITNSPNRYSLKPGDRFVIITQEPITVPVVLQEIEALLKTLG